MGLSAIYMAQELCKLNTKDLTPDESLLYVQVFRRHGFSVTEFRQLLHQGGATWQDVSSEQVVDSAGSGRLSFIIRGRGQVHDASSPTFRGKASKPVVTLGLGGVIGEAAFLQDCSTFTATGDAAGGVCRAHVACLGLEREYVIIEKGARLVSWDAKRLCEYISLKEASRHKLHALLTEAAAAKLLGGGKTPPPVAGSGGKTSTRKTQMESSTEPAAEVASQLTTRQRLDAAVQHLKANNPSSARAALSRGLEELLSNSCNDAIQPLLELDGWLEQQVHDCGARSVEPAVAPSGLGA